jgi:hypothetical protein
MKDYIKNMLKTQFTIQLLMLGIVFMIASLFAFKEVLTYVAFICFFTTFDVCGYGNMIEPSSDNGTIRWEDQTILTPYRIMQNMFMVMIFIAVYFYTNWICLLACILGWWYGGCDLLYYILLKRGVREQDHYWMRNWSVWLVLTPIKKFLCIEEYIGRKEFIFVTILGLVTGFLISLVA